MLTLEDHSKAQLGTTELAADLVTMQKIG